jgi:DNA-binding NtrC family response regulator
VDAGVRTPKGQRRNVQIEVQDDPRSAERKVLLLHASAEIHHARGKRDAEFANIIGKSPPMQQVFQAIRDLARVDSTVLIEGETGTGKELVAQAIHCTGRRRAGAFVALNCAGLSEELAASQLFGHKRGAFTSAIDDHTGLFETASGGTLFLDEIGDLPLRVQTTLLRVLEERAVRRVGESTLRAVDTRIIAATNHNLAKQVEEKTFRRDLFYRIHVGRVRLPALRDRREDIPLLARAFCADLAVSTGRDVDSVGEDALAILVGHSWPGNVRELKNALEYAVIHAPTPVIRVQDLPPEILEKACGTSQPDERSRILAALQRTGGNRKEAAVLLGMSRATFYRRLAQLGMDEGESGAGGP